MSAPTKTLDPMLLARVRAFRSIERGRWYERTKGKRLRIRGIGPRSIRLDGGIVVGMAQECGIPPEDLDAYIEAVEMQEDRDV